MKRDWIVNARTHTISCEAFLHFAAVLHPNYVQVIYRLAPLWLERKNQAIHRRQQLPVILGVVSTLTVPCCQVAQFHTKDPSLNRIQPSVVTLQIMVVLLCLAMIAQ